MIYERLHSKLASYLERSKQDSEISVDAVRSSYCVRLWLISNAPFLQASNEETKEHLYETLLAECRDTIQAVREELKSEAVRHTSLKI